MWIEVQINFNALIGDTNLSNINGTHARIFYHVAVTQTQWLGIAKRFCVKQFQDNYNHGFRFSLLYIDTELIHVLQHVKRLSNVSIKKTAFLYGHWLRSVVNNTVNYDILILMAKLTKQT